MTNCSRGDIVLVRFIFADEEGIKQRPALIVSSNRYHKSRQEAIVAAITSNVSRLLYGDHKIRGWREAGLLFPSTVTGILRTIKQDMIIRKIGALRASDFQMAERSLQDALGLSPSGPQTYGTTPMHGPMP